LLAGTLVACGGGTEAVPEPKAPEAVQPALADTSWNLTSLQGNEVLPGTTVTAVFGQYNTLTGSAGCNEYSTSYQVEGSSISIGSVVTTKMSCPEPEGIMVQENAYLAILENLATYRIQGDQLDLSSVDGELVATFAASPPAPLEGTPWRLYAYNDEQGAVIDPLPGTEITATFGDIHPDGLRRARRGHAARNGLSGAVGIGGQLRDPGQPAQAQQR
jgi:heat shock protein HslJ